MAGHIDHQPVETFTSSGSGVLAFTVEPQQAYRLLEARIHLDAASGTVENFTITADSTAGTEFDDELESQDMNGLADHRAAFEIPPFFDPGDELDFAWANTNSRTFGLTVKIVLI